MDDGHTSGIAYTKLPIAAPLVPESEPPLVTKRMMVVARTVRWMCRRALGV